MVVKVLPSPSALIASILVILAISILLRLGFWQLERADQKRQRLEQISQRQSNSNYSLSQVLSLKKDINDYPVYIDGTVVQQKYFLWDNRVLNGRVGYEVLVPVVTNQGWVMVNLGWVPLGHSRQHLPPIALPTATDNWKGVVSIPQMNPLVRQVEQSEQWPFVIQQPDLDLMSVRLNQALLPLVIYLQQPSLFESNWKPVVMSPEKHVGYSIQWFGLAIACSVVFLVVMVRQRGISSGS